MFVFIKMYIGIQRELKMFRSDDCDSLTIEDHTTFISLAMKHVEPILSKIRALRTLVRITLPTMRVVLRRASKARGATILDVFERRATPLAWM